MALVGAVALGACGSEQYRYVESDDGHMFGKVPHDWTIESEGGIGFKFLLDSDFDLAITRGDTTFPWRAKFAADGETDQVPSGVFETQFVDARIRDRYLLRELIEGLLPAGATAYERTKVALGDLEGYRTTYDVKSGDDVVHYDEVYLINDRRSAVYVASVHCSAECFERYGDEIDELLTGIWVDQ